MPTPAENTYSITELNKTNAEPIEVKAARAVTDSNTGRTSFYDGQDNLVAAFVNINFYKKG